VRCLALALALCLAAPARADRIESAKISLEKLRSDPRRSRYRDGWEAIVRQLQASAKAGGPRAAEAALLAARVRAELFGVSRSPADGRAAIAAFRRVDDDYPGRWGKEALHAAVQLSWHTKDAGDRVAAARRLIERYPESAEAKTVAARTAALVGKQSPPGGHNPVETEEGDDDEDDPPEEVAPESPPERHGPIVKAVNDAVAAWTEPEDPPLTAAKAREIRSAALASRSSLAAQLGLKVKRVVLDPGHGGRDRGATGPHGIREKDVALAIAKRVAAQLRALGFAVVMTRKDDRFVSLDDRTRIANEARADLFVSIHCNASRRRRLAGAETWTLNVGSDRYSARLAAFENAEADRTVSDLRLILADLATKANAGDARELAQAVQSSLVRKTRGRDHGVKQALFYVLLGAHMPAVLVETGFISNPAEEARLKSARFQETAAEAISRGVKDFVDTRRRLARGP